ncbi:hypothetical protein KUCAC02_037486 [Chaenocephalus aceratus]|nr:hypothetical protein KUCAC02_037486 [Chaenocephalus aceratus]
MRHGGASVCTPPHVGRAALRRVGEGVRLVSQEAAECGDDSRDDRTPQERKRSLRGHSHHYPHLDTAIITRIWTQPSLPTSGHSDRIDSLLYIQRVMFANTPRLRATAPRQRQRRDKRQSPQVSVPAFELGCDTQSHFSKGLGCQRNGRKESG